MERITPYLTLFLLCPVYILGCIISILYYGIKFMKHPLDLNSFIKGYRHAIDLDKEFWTFLKNYLTTLNRNFISGIKTRLANLKSK